MIQPYVCFSLLWISVFLRVEGIVIFFFFFWYLCVVILDVRTKSLTLQFCVLVFICVT